MKDYLELYQDSPSKIKMRNHLNRKGEEKCGYKHWNHNDDIIRSVEKFIHKNIGNNFDIVYSKFCNNLLPTFPHKTFGKYWFWRMFRYTSYSDGEYFTNITSRWQPRYVYYITEDGKIAFKNNKIKRDSKLFIDSCYRTYYRKSDFTKSEWKKLTAEVASKKRKKQREYIKEKEETNQYLLDIISNNRKQKEEI